MTASGVPTWAWLLARLWLHDTYNRRLPKNLQEPLWGSALNSVDWLEVSRLELELSAAAADDRQEEVH